MTNPQAHTARDKKEPKNAGTERKIQEDRETADKNDTGTEMDSGNGSTDRLSIQR